MCNFFRFLSVYPELIFQKNDYERDNFVGPSASCLLKGVLWQQREKRFSRWKERFFIVTNDYLQCFRRGTSKLSEMGSFIYRIRLCEVRQTFKILEKCRSSRFAPSFKACFNSFKSWSRLRKWIWWNAEVTWHYAFHSHKTLQNYFCAKPTEYENGHKCCKKVFLQPKVAKSKPPKNFGRVGKIQICLRQPPAFQKRPQPPFYPIIWVEVAIWKRPLQWAEKAIITSKQLTMVWLIGLHLQKRKRVRANLSKKVLQGAKEGQIMKNVVST